jgi:type I restriction enzyme S subunit
MSAECAAQSIPAGYKQTEVGVIPEDWEIAPLGEVVAKFVHGGTPSTKHEDYWKGDIPWITGADILDQRVSEIRRFITTDAVKNSSTNVVNKGNLLLVSRTGVGKLAIALCDIAISQDFTGICTKSERLSTEYLFRFLDMNQAILKNQNQGTSILGITRDTLSSLTILFPPTLAEQQAIAQALTNVDALIESLEQLIAKKRQIKQGAMQELLNGKRRLPGFSGEWEVKSLGDLFDFSGGLSASRDQLSTEGYCYLHYGDIHTSNKTFIDVKKEKQDIPKLDIPLKKVSSTSLLENGDVVFVDASEDDEGTSKHVVIFNEEKIPFISGLHTIVAKSKTKELDYHYRRYCFQTTDIKQQFRFFAVGTKVSGISKANIVKITLPVPPVEEQAAIATILSDMDAEIAALEEKLEKSRMLKQGMMQELLTGRIRLV